MTRRSNLGCGLVLLAAVAAAIIFHDAIIRLAQTAFPGIFPPAAATATATPAVTEVYVYGGYRYFEDTAIQSILHDKYQIDVTGEFKKGTFAMSDDYDPAKQKVDCIFPGSKIGIEYFNEKHPKVILKSVTAAQDRIVVFTWQEMLPKLEQAGLVYSKDESLNIRMKPLVDAMIAGQKWHDIGVDVPGYVRTEFTDPVTSSSGLQWMAFVGAYLVPGNEDGGKTLSGEDLSADPTILPRLYKYWEDQGAQVDTTAKLFGKFVSSGMGMPMIVAYESSYTDWYMPLSADQKTQATKIVGVYPEITINIEHILASLTPACNPLLDAIQAPEIQQLAQDNHGLHPQGLPPQCPKAAPWCDPEPPVVPEPKKDVTDVIKACLKDGTLCAP